MLRDRYVVYNAGSSARGLKFSEICGGKSAGIKTEAFVDTVKEGTWVAETPGGSRSSTCRASSSEPKSAPCFLGLFFTSLTFDVEATGLSRPLSFTRVSSCSPLVMVSSWSLSRWIRRSCSSSLCFRQLSFSSFRFFVRLLWWSN